MGRCISTIEDGSIAALCGLDPGDTLLEINGQPVRDYIDYAYAVAEENLLLLIRKADGREEELEIEKDAYEELGIGFADDGFGKKIVCRNKCVFCFVDQMPKGMRKTLYFKDDDWRMSFLMGSYITLTNLNDADIERIVAQHISPLYVSVHAYDHAVHNMLLGNDDAQKTFDILRCFVENGIEVHTQVVMCEGLNDKEILRETIEELYALYPGIRSLAVVPAGLTQFRENRYPIEPVSNKNARKTVEMIHEYQQQFLSANKKTRFVFAADEMYIKAGMGMPSLEEYECFEQIENGVGMVRTFVDDAMDALEGLKGEKARYLTIGMVTGMDFYPFLKRIAQEAEERLGVLIRVYPVKNEFFGETVTVTGLLTGRDIMAQLKGKIQDEVLFLSSCCFKENEEAMLDDVSLNELEHAFGVSCRKIDNDGYELIHAMLEE
ncbi:MAG: DUF512 domain-containing protein [Christensenella sp.]|uniref:DUF512 domain-containing protein n=1 Tax=Christensenella sp. TaxID=1935934 RepID=UPI002B1F2094|nr:DUF512 domain-containing protein [Christensenella sp.]MEA5003703.1 DUF512 domain-containing protein [Christensenella sp.]